jgi:hypothetical protein
MDEVIKIDLKSEGRSVIKTGMSVKATLIFLLTSLCFWSALRFWKESWLAVVILLVIGIVLFRIAYKMLGSAFSKESILLSPGRITIVQVSAGVATQQEFKLDDIIYLGYANQQYTSHQMDNPVVDFTGLGVGERELQYVIDEGNILLQTRDKVIKFGKNMPSWDVEEVITQIEAITGRKFDQPKNKVSEDEIPD